MPFDWNKFKDGDRYKFVNVGDKIEGSLVQITTTDFGGTADVTPVLHLKTENGAVVTVTASQTVLCSRLADAAPEVGDYLSITFTGEDVANARPGRSPAKLFDVIVKRGESGPPSPGGAAAAPPPPPGDDAMPAVPGYPPPTAAQLADPKYRAWYDANLPKSPPPPPPIAEADEPF